MKTISILVGAILLTTSLVLSYLSSSNAEKLIEKKNKIMTSYITQAQEKLQNNDTKGAIKFAKLAIQTDPKSKDGFKIYEEIMQHIYNVPQDTNTIKPQDEENKESEEEVDMGC